MSVAFGIQHAQRMSGIILLFVGCLALPYLFPHFLINGKIFGGKKLLNIKWVFPFSLKFCLKYSHYKKEWARCDKKLCWSSCKVAVILVIFYWDLNCWRDFRKILKHQLLLTSAQWRPSCSMRMGRWTRTDRHNGANSRFWKFCERAKKKLTKDLNLCMTYHRWQKCSGVLSVFSWNWKKHTHLFLEFRTGQR